MERHKIWTSTNILVIKYDKVLLSRRQNKDWGNGLLCLPGGHIEAEESPRNAVIREAKEELGLEIDSAKLKFCCVAARNTSGKEYVAYEFVYELGKDEHYENAEPDQCTELIWCATAKLPRDIIEDYKIVIEQGYLNKKSYLEIGYD